MANQVNLTATILSFADSDSQMLSVGEKVDFEITVPPNTTDMQVPLTGIATPKVLYVKGARGVSLKLAALGTSIPCNKFFLMTNVDVPQALDALFISNGDTQEHKVLIVAAE
jgi:hypothetical protein